jgi:hypothetical protein
MTTIQTALVTGVLSALIVASGAMAASAIHNEPLVIYDVSGHGIAGPIHQHLAVYSSGLASFSRQSVTGTSSEFTSVPPWQVRALIGSLLDYGVMTLEDLPEPGADLPLHTLTVFSSSAPAAPNHTFSFYDPTNPSAAMIVSLLNGFVAQWFGEEPEGPPESLRGETPLRAWRIGMEMGQRMVSREMQLALEFVDVPSDTRCPIDVQCVWAGDVQIVLNIWHQGVDQGEFILTLGAETEASSLVRGEIEIRLLGVHPQPVTDRPIRLEDYRIRLQVSER